jgi:hypothetical protein
MHSRTNEEDHMNLDWSATDLAFRDEVRSFLDEKLTAELRQADRLVTSVYSDHEEQVQVGLAVPAAGYYFTRPLRPSVGLLAAVMYQRAATFRKS